MGVLKIFNLILILYVISPKPGTNEREKKKQNSHSYSSYQNALNAKVGIETTEPMLPGG